MKTARVDSRPVPFLDLKKVHRDLEVEILEAWRTILREAAFVGGGEVAAFEQAFAGYVGVEHCVGVSSGTDALRLALLALGLQPGDEVITVPHTFIATTEAISQAGGRPVFVDVDEATGTLDPARLEAALTPRTRGIVPVHLYGHPAPMEPILNFAEAHGLWVLEDAAQAHGARLRGRRLGSFGAAAAFSFYPGKNLGACGEAGAVTTSDPEVAERVRRLRDHGQPAKYHHEREGYNARLDALQAAALRIKLPHLDDWNASRRRAAAWYDEALDDAAVTLPREADGAESVYHLYVIRHPERDRLQKALGERGIGTGLHYPVALHLQPAYASLGLAAGSFPVAEAWARTCLSLPMFPGITREQVDRVAAAVRELAG